MTTYRVALRVLDLLVCDVMADDEEEAKERALFALAKLCAEGEESTVKVEAVAEVELA